MYTPEEVLGGKMSFWLCVLTEDNWKVVRDEKIWGVSGRHSGQILKTKVNDFLVFYVKQRRDNNDIIGPQIKAISKVTSEPFMSEEPIFVSLSMREKYPWRVKIEHVVIPEKPLDFKTLVPELKFVKYKKKWFLSIIGKAMRAIQREDFELIRSGIGNRR